jgi:hypothetical protein
VAERVAKTSARSFAAASAVCDHRLSESRPTALAISITKPSRCWIERLRRKLDRQCPPVWPALTRSEPSLLPGTVLVREWDRRSHRSCGHPHVQIGRATHVPRTHGGERPNTTPPPPRSVDRTLSLARVSKKREYFKCRAETIGDFAPKLFKLGV